MNRFLPVSLGPWQCEAAQCSGGAGFNSIILCKGPVVQEAWAASGLKPGHGAEPQGCRGAWSKGRRVRAAAWEFRQRWPFVPRAVQTHSGVFKERESRAGFDIQK